MDVDVIVFLEEYATPGGNPRIHVVWQTVARLPLYLKLYLAAKYLRRLFTAILLLKHVL